jgi:hypothetical protein
MTPHDVPYFVDNGAYTDSFEFQQWLEALEKAKQEMPRWPDFIVWPDVYNDAKATQNLVDNNLYQREVSLLPRRDDFDRYVVFQPGAPLDEQFAWAKRHAADGIFLGGEQRWQRAYGPEIVRRAHDQGRRVHLGNPGGKDGLLWAYQTGFDSVDTTTIFQNGYWHYLDAIERATENTRSPKLETSQTRLSDATAANW